MKLKKSEVLWKRGMAFLLAAALLWTDSSVTTLAAGTSAAAAAESDAGKDAESPTEDEKGTGEQKAEADKDGSGSKTDAEDESGKDESGTGSENGEEDGSGKGNENAPEDENGIGDGTASGDKSDAEDEDASQDGSGKENKAAAEESEQADGESDSVVYDFRVSYQDYGTIYLEWDMEDGDSVQGTKYCIYRSDDEDGTYTLLTTYTRAADDVYGHAADTEDVWDEKGFNKTYYYKISIVEVDGTESDWQSTEPVTNDGMLYGYAYDPDTGAVLEDTDYQGICLIGSDGDQVTAIDLYKEEYGEYEIALVKKDGSAVTLASLADRIDWEDNDCYLYKDGRQTSGAWNAGLDQTSDVLAILPADPENDYAFGLVANGQSGDSRYVYVNAWFQIEETVYCYYDQLPVDIRASKDGADYTKWEEGLNNVYLTTDGLTAGLRGDLVNRESVFEYRVRQDVYAAWQSEGLAKVYDFNEERQDMQPNEGDYIQNQNGALADSMEMQLQDMTGDVTDISGGLYNGQDWVSVSFEQTYFTTKEQEDAVDTAIDDLLRGSGDLNNFYAANYHEDGRYTPAEAKAIADELSEYVHQTTTYKSGDQYRSCYSAAVDHVADSEGYSLYFMRLCREFGIAAKILGDDAGYQKDTVHIYNIVQIDQDNDVWYYYDAADGKQCMTQQEFNPGQYLSKYTDDEKFVENYLNKIPYSETASALYLDGAEEESTGVQIIYAEGTEKEVSQTYDSLNDAITNMTKDFGKKSGEYSFVLLDNCELTGNISIPTFVTKFTLKGDTTTSDAAAKALDMKGYTLTIPIVKAEISSDVIICNSNNETTAMVKHTAKNAVLTYYLGKNIANLDNCGIEVNTSTGSLIFYVDENATAGQTYTIGGTVKAKNITIDTTNQYGQLTFNTVTASTQTTICGSGEYVEGNSSISFGTLTSPTVSVTGIAPELTFYESLNVSKQLSFESDANIYIEETAAINEIYNNYGKANVNYISLYRKENSNISIQKLNFGTDSGTMLDIGVCQSFEGQGMPQIIDITKAPYALFTTSNTAFPVGNVQVVQSDVAKYQRVYQLGGTVYLGTDWITVKAGNGRVINSFVKWSDASAYLTTLANSSMEYTVEISEDVDTQAALSLPSKAAKVTFKGTAAQPITFKYVGDITLPTDVTFENINLQAEVYNKTSASYVDDTRALKLNAKTLTLVNSTAEFTDISGTASLALENSTVTATKTVTLTNASLTDSTLTANSTINIKDKLYMKSSTLSGGGKITLKDVISNDDHNKLVSADNAKNIMTITGNVSAEDGSVHAIDVSVKTLEGSYAENTLLLTAQKVSSDWFVVGSTFDDEGNRSYIWPTVKSGTQIKCSKVDYNVSLIKLAAGSKEITIGRFNTAQEAFKEIDNLADTQSSYIVEIVGDASQATNIKTVVTFPTKAAEVTVRGTGVSGNTAFSYKGALTLKTNLNLENLELTFSDKNGAVNLGNYVLTLTDCTVAADKYIGTVNGSGVAAASALVLDSPGIDEINGNLNKVGRLELSDESSLTIHGTITVGDMYLGSETLSAENTITVNNIICEDATVGAIAKVTRNKAYEITNIVPQITVSGRIEADDNLTFSLLEKTTDGYTPVTFADASDSYRAQGIYIAKAQNASTEHVAVDKNNFKSGGVITKKAGYLTLYMDAVGYGADLIYTSGDEEITTHCLTLADAVTEINNLKTKREYTIQVTDEATDIAAPSAIKMPNKNMAQTLTITGAEDSTTPLYYTGGITYTSDTVLKDLQFVQMVKSGKEYFDITEKSDYQQTVGVSAGGYSLIIGGYVSFNTPIALDGGRAGSFAISEEGTLVTVSAQIESDENELYGKLSSFATVSVGESGLTVSKYESKANTYTGGDLTTAALNISDDGMLEVAGNLTVSSKLFVNSGYVNVSGKGSFKDVAMSGGDANISVDLDFAITGTLTSTTSEAHLYTRRKLDKKAANCIPYLNVSGTVDLEDSAAHKIYVGVRPNIQDEDPDSFVTLENAPDATAVLFTSAKADVICFRAENENVGIDEYSASHPEGYILRKAGGKIYVYYGNDVVAALCSGTVTDGSLAKAEVINYYTTFAEAVSEIEARKDKSSEYTILLMNDAGEAGAPISISMPAQAAKVTVCGANGSIRDIYYSNSITVNTPTEFKDVNLLPTALDKKKNNVNASTDIAVQNYSVIFNNVGFGGTVNDKTSAVRNITGRGKGVITVDGAALAVTGSITGLSEADFNRDMTVAGNLNATSLNIKGSNAAGTSETGAKSAATDVTVTGAVTATNLVLDHATLTGKAALTATNLALTNATLTGKKALTITNITSNGGTIDYVRDAGDRYHNTTLTIKGTVTNINPQDKLNLIMHLTGSETEDGLQLILTEAKGVKKTSLDAKKKLANIEKLSLSDFAFEMVDDNAGSSTPASPTGNLVKADKALWLTNDDTYKNAVEMTSTASTGVSEYLDLNYAVSEINQLNNKNAEYTITVEGTGITDTCITDTAAVSGFKIPDKNKAKKVTISSGSDTARKSIVFTGVAAGNVELELSGIQCDMPGNFTASAGLTLDNAKLSVTGKTTITNLTLKNTATLDMLGVSAITNIDTQNAAITGEDANVSYIAAKQDKNGKPQLTVSGKVAGTYVPCRLITHGSAVAEGISYESVYKDQNLLIASSEAAQKFAAFPFRNLAAQTQGTAAVEEIAMGQWCAYKDKNNYVKNGNKSAMAVEVSDNAGLTTYAETFDAAVSIIDSIKNKQAVYTITLLNSGAVLTGTDGTTYAGLKLPSQAAQVTIKGSGSSAADTVLNFTGEVTLGCNTVFDNVYLTSGTLSKSKEYTPSYKIGLNMGNYSATFNSGAGTGISGDKTIITCTKVSGKKALNLNGQQLTAENSTIEVVDLNLSGGASVSADKKIVATNLSSGGTDPVSVETKAAMQFTNISGSAPIKLHYYYTAKALTQTNNASKTATTQLTISGDINMIDSAKVTLIPSIYNAETKEYAQVSSDGILTLTVGNTVYVCQKLAAMPKAAAEDIVFSYDNGIIRGASDVVGARLYKYNGGLYITDQEMAVELVGKSDGQEVYRAEYMSFADAVKEINTRNNKAMDYEIRLLKNIGFNGSELAPTGGLSLPSNAKSVTILPAEGDKTGNAIAFTGGVTLGCNTTIENVCLVGAQKPRNKTYYEQTSYAVNVGGYTLTERGQTWKQEINGEIYVKSVSVLSGNARGSYIAYIPVNPILEAHLADQIKNVGKVELRPYHGENDGEGTYGPYAESDMISGVNELILDKNVDLCVDNAAVTANYLTMNAGSILRAKNVTISKDTTLNKGSILARASTIGDGKITLNNIILKSDGNLIQGKQDKNGRSLITINGTVTADESFTGTREGAITAAIMYNNDDSAYAQLHTGMVLLTAQKASPYWFIPAYNYNTETYEDTYETETVYKMGEQDAGYGLLKSGKEIIYGQTDVASAEAELVINAGTASEQHTLFKTFEEAVKEIDSLALYKDGTKTYADYKIILHKDVEIGNEKQNGRYNALALPSKVGTLTIEGGNHEIRFSGNLTLKSNLILSNTTITPVKTSGTVGVATKANWVLGNFNLALNNVVTANASGSLVGNISGNASRTELVLTGTSITADQVSGIKTCTLDPGTSLETVKTMTVTNLVLNTDGNVDNGSTTIRCGGKMTVTLITKNGTDEVVIVKPSAGTLAIAGATFADGLSDSEKKLTIEMEGGNYPTGTVILSGKAANASYYTVYTSQDDSSNVYRTYVSGTNLLLGQIDTEN